MLLARGKRDSQPQRLVGIARDIPKPTGLWLPNLTNLELVSGIAPSVDATFTTNSTSGGVGINVTATGRRYAKAHLSGATQYAGLFIAYRDASAGPGASAYSVFREDGVVTAVQEFAGSVDGRIWSGGAQIMSWGSPSYFVNKVSVFGFTGGVAGGKYYLDGKLMGTVPSGSVDGGSGLPFCIGATESGGEIATPWTVLGAAVWDRCPPSPEQIRRLTEFPWRLLDRKSIWVPVSAGGGGGSTLFRSRTISGSRAGSRRVA